MDLDMFNEQHLSKIMNILDKEKKLCYLMGDFNVDLLKAENDENISHTLKTLASPIVISSIYCDATVQQHYHEVFLLAKTTT